MADHEGGRGGDGVGGQGFGLEGAGAAEHSGEGVVYEGFMTGPVVRVSTIVLRR